MPRFVPQVVLLLFCAALINCAGNGSHIPQQPIPNIAGSWEFIAYSNSPGSNATGIEVALQEGQTLLNGIYTPSGQVSASSSQIAFLTLNPTSSDVVSFGGPCLPTATPSNSVTEGSVSAFNAPFNFTFTENGNTFNVTGTLAGDGQSLLNGTYSSPNGSACIDSGSITGMVVSKLSGIYVGKLTLPDGTTDSATATLSEGSGANLTVNLVVTGTDNTSFTMTGPVTGNAFSVQGTFQGQTVEYYGYNEVVKNVQSIYFVNATNPAQPAYAGTLGVPQM
jgi:hypothetical protein